MFSTLSTNFTGALETGVDPRNGQFYVNLPLAQFNGNQLMGPCVSLSARYSSLSDLNSNGLGKGFSLGGLSFFNRVTRRLTLSSGESWPVDTNSSIPDRRLKDCLFLRTFANNNIEEYRLSWKSGVTEYLSLVGDNIFATTRILSPIGKELKLKWLWNGTSALLITITDLQSDLCRFEYNGSNVNLTIWPKTNEECQLIFAIQNLHLHSIRRLVSETEWLEWKLNYSLVGPSDQQRINSLTCPTGMSYTVSYYKQKGLDFPSASGLQWLPVVESYTQNYGAGQPPKKSRYTFTSNNFLGHNSSTDVFGSWSTQSDYIYGVLTKDYTYGSTETIETQNDNVSIFRTYNNYHFLISTKTVRNGCTVLEETEYYAETGKLSKIQPPQYMLPNKQIITFEDSKHNKRSEETITFFDDYGNPTYIKSADGTVTKYEYYPAEYNANCPTEPYGFIRFVKQKTVEPSISSFSDTPLHITRYTYSTLGNTNYIVQKTISEYRGVLDIKLLTQRTMTYDEDINSSKFGSITTIIDEKFVHGENSPKFKTQLNFMNSINHGILVQQVTFKGFDGLSTITTRRRSVYTGLLYSETSTQGVETQYGYDALGRVTRRTLSPKSEYENTTIWQYVIEPNGPCTIECDELGNKNKTHFDGTGRIVRRSTFDANTSKWYDTFSCNHNHLGEVSNGIVMDSVAGGTDFSLSSDITFGGWGEKKTVTYSDGRTVQQETDPINLTHTIYSYGGSNTNIVRNGSITTILDKISQLPVRRELRDNAGKLESVYHYSWDGLGQLREEEDELGALTKRTYDEYGRVLTQGLPDGTVVNRMYAPHLTGNQITYMSIAGLDAIENSRTWILGTQTFDSLGRLTKSTSGGRTTKYTYMDSAPVPSTILFPSGKIQTYTYIPELGNVISSKTTDSITQTFKCVGKTGKLLRAIEEESQIENTWTLNGLKEEAFTRNKQIRRAKYTRTLNEVPITYTDVSGKKTSYTMNDHGRIISIYDDTITVHLTYNILGHLKTQTIKDNNSTSSLNIDLNFDSFGREVTRTITNSQGVKVVLSQTWQINGLLSMRTTHKNDVKVLEEEYGYDKRNRLVTFISSGSSLPIDPYGHAITSQRYCYDALNNITIINTTLSDCTTNTATYNYGNDDDPTQLTSITNTHADYPKSISLIYDSDGRMTHDEAGRTLKYDTMGRLVSIDGSNDSASAKYSYDALNRLISEKVGNNYVTEMYYRGEELVNEVIPSQHRETRLIKSGHTCLAVSHESNLNLIAGDIHDSVLWSEDVGLADKGGQLYIWPPYGNGNSGNGLPGFNGERIDPVSGVYHLGDGYRAYNPVLMRFNCPDSLSPFGMGGINPYAYCSGDPVNRTDPSGHLSAEAIFGIVWGSIGLLGAVITGGVSIVAAGGIMAAISSTSAATLILGGVATVSQVTGIVGDALEEVAPETSSILGWISLGTGVPGMVLHFGHSLHAAIHTAFDETLDTVDIARNFVRDDMSIRMPKRYTIKNPKRYERFGEVTWDKTRDRYVKKFMASQKITNKFTSNERHPKQFIGRRFDFKDKRIQRFISKNIRNNFISNENSSKFTRNTYNKLYGDTHGVVKFGSCFKLIDRALLEHLNLPTPYLGNFHN